MMTADNLLITNAMVSPIRWLASRCDFATTNDGKGFSGTDAPLGHALAQKEVWSPRETLAACRLLVKYKKQVMQGGFDISGVNDSIIDLEKVLGKKQPLRRRDVVSGSFSVVDGKIVLKSGYNEELLAETRELLGAEWDKNAKKWLFDLCAENAVAIEDIAQRFGLVLNKDNDWASLAPTRFVKVCQNRLLVGGVNARRITQSILKLQGQPDDDVKVFRAIEKLDQTTIAIPLTSWVIKDFLLLIAGGEEEDDNLRRLSWALSDIQRELVAIYPKSLERERVLFERASAIALPSETHKTFTKRLPLMMTERLMSHQWVAVQAIVESPQIILADQQGLGKTIEILVALESISAFPAIVISPATALLNWRDEAVTWLPHRKVAVLGASIGKKDLGVSVEDAEIIILNYDSFAKHQARLATLQLAALVADEAQYLKGHASARTEAVKNFCSDTGVKRIIAATGTPVMNRPAELLTLLTLLPDLLVELGGFGFIAARYCRATRHSSFFQDYWDYGGASNLGELANRLRETGRFIRREKASVLPQLLCKQREEIEVEITNRLDYRQASENLQEWLKTHNKKKDRRAQSTSRDDNISVLREAAAWLGWGADEINSLYLDSGDRAEALRQMTALRQLTGLGKIAAAVAWIKDCVKDEKLVVFAYHIEVQQSLTAALSEMNPVLLTGDMTARARREAILRFQTDPDSRVIICSLKAAQTAITLTAAQRALILELDWTPSALEQAEDRIHRIGQTGQVVITYLVATNTLDDRMSAILEIKRETINQLSGSGAPYGYRKDGAPRKQYPGPGRPRLDPEARSASRKASKAGWQERNLDYMRDYMRKRRYEAVVKELKLAEQELKSLMVGYDVLRRKLGQYYTPELYEEDLAEVQERVKRFQNKLNRTENLVKYT